MWSILIELQGWRSQILDDRLLHNRCTDFDSVSWRLLGSTSTTRRYELRVCRIKAHEIAVVYGGGINVNPGRILLDGRFLYNRFTDSNSDFRRLLGLVSASQRYKVRLCRMISQEVAVHSRGGSLAEFYLRAVSSTTAARISILVLWRLLGSAVATQRYKVRLYTINTHGAIGLAIPNTRWLIPPQPLPGFRFCSLEVVGPNRSYTLV